MIAAVMLGVLALVMMVLVVRQDRARDAEMDAALDRWREYLAGVYGPRKAVPALDVEPARFAWAAERLPRELLCQMCGRDYPIWYAPNDLWNAVMRYGDQGNADEYDFVCPTCFTVHAAFMGVESVFEVRVGDDRELESITPAALPTNED